MIKVRILIAEDEEEVSKVLARLMKKQILSPVEIISAKSCVAAKKALIEDNFDLVTIDGELPDGYGLNLIEEAKKNSTKVVMVSGNSEFASPAIEMGADAFINKDPEMVPHLIQCFIDCHFRLRR